MPPPLPRLAPLLVLTVLFALGAAPAFGQKFEGLALTPPMGWNTWNRFGCNINETLIRETADAFVSSGMRAAGYRYLIIDDCWQIARGADGTIQADPDRFPSGIKALADYVHARGLKLGLYSDAGTKTCEGRPGSFGYEQKDAATYAAWGVDYVKYDWCFTAGLNAPAAYRVMRNAIRATGRPMVFSLCEWGHSRPWEWAASVGHLWRTSNDLRLCFDCEVHSGNWISRGAMRVLDLQVPLRAHAGPDGWNDPDIMQVGNGMTAGEDRAHFAMWAMIAAPLIAGNDVRRMSRETAALLTNREVIAVDQDALGIQGFRYAVRDSLEIWFKPLARGDWAMAVLNRSRTARSLTFDWAHEPLTDALTGLSARFDTTVYRLRDVLDKLYLGTTRSPLDVRVPSHDVRMLRLSAPGSPQIPDALAAFPNPTSGPVRIDVTLPDPGVLKVLVYDELGRRVQSFDAGLRTIGRQTVTLSLKDLPPGRYVVRLSSGWFKAHATIVRQ